MSLYQVSKLLYQLNRDDDFQRRFRAGAEDAIENYMLTAEESRAILTPDIGLLYVLGVNGQILMHFAAFCGIKWSDYINRMREGVSIHGPVRSGIYATTLAIDEKVAGI